MVELEKILNFINSENWEELTREFDQLLRTYTLSENKKSWLEDFSEEKITIIDSLEKKLEILRLNSIDTENIHNFEETALKLFSKGLILPELNHYEDVGLLHKLINSSKSTKYLFMLYQENLYEINEIYQSQSFSILDKVNLKSLSIIPAFIRLAGQNIFPDVAKKFQEFYSSYRKIVEEENVIGEPDKELEAFFTDFAEKAILEFSKLIIQNTNKDLSKKLIEKEERRKELFELMKLLFTHHPAYTTEIKSLVNKIVMNLEFGLEKFEEVPSFWINIESLAKVYSNEQIFFVIGTVLIRELPSRPEYSQIPSHLLDLLQWILLHLFSQKEPIKSLTLRNNNIFFVQLFERLSILMGLLNNSNENEKIINQYIKNLFNKKDLFASVYLVEILWRKLITSHEDISFKIFCLGQYKKVFLLPVKEVTFVEMNVLKSGSDLMMKLVSELEGNSNAEYIGFVLTLLIYYFSFLKKYQNFCSKSEISLENSKKQAVMMYIFSSEKILLIKQEIKAKLFKLKESLKDRLEVFKMKKLNEQPESVKFEKEANEISICIYRIEEEIKFD